MKQCNWYNQTEEVPPVGSGVLLPEYNPSMGGTAPAATTPPASTGFNADLFQSILTSGLAVTGAVAANRRASGASSSRQQRIAACGRKPLFGRARKEEYEKCVANAQRGADLSTQMYVPPAPPARNNTLLFVGLGVVAVGAAAFFILRKK